MDNGNDNDLDVCVIGAGIGGLATALALQQAGFRVAVFERDASMADRKQGYGLTLTNSLMGPLAKLGLLDECIARNCPSHCHFIFNPAGEIMGYFGRAIKDLGAERTSAYQQADHGGNRGNLRIPRQELRQMMIAKLAPGCIHWGHRLESYQESQDAVTVFLQGDRGETKVVRTQVLVGADGLWSKVRRIYDPTATLRFLTITVIIGISSITDPLLTNMGYYILDGQHRLFTMPFLSTSSSSSSSSSSASETTPSHPLIMWQLSFSGMSEEEALSLKQSSPEVILRTALQRVHTWMPAVQRLLEATLPAEVWATPLYDRDAMDVSAIHRAHTSGKAPSAESFGRVTVIGDACHPMSMFKGQGANQALEDGPRLAHALLQAVQRDGVKQINAKATGMQPTRKRKAGEEQGREETEKEEEESEGTSEDARTSSAESTTHRLLHSLPVRYVHSVLRRFEREMVARTSKKVLASRLAAHQLHSPQVFDDIPAMEKGEESREENEREEEKEREDAMWRIAGVKRKDYARLVHRLRHKQITAVTCPTQLEKRLVEEVAHMREKEREGDSHL